MGVILFSPTTQYMFSLLPPSVVDFVDYRDNESHFSTPRLQEMNARDWLGFSCISFLRSFRQDFGLPKL